MSAEATLKQHYAAVKKRLAGDRRTVKPRKSIRQISAKATP